MPELIALETDPTIVAHIPAAFLTTGKDSDMDAAFDAAVDTAWYEYGHAGVTPSIASSDPGSIEVADSIPTSKALATRSAQIHLETATPGVTYARALCADSAYRRRRVSLVVNDISVNLPATKGVIPYLSANQAADLIALATAGALGPNPGELLESVDVRTHNQRFKPVVEVHRDATRRLFVAIETTTGTTLATGQTAGEARRAAVALAKTGPLGHQQSYTLEIYQQVGRQPHFPLITVVRTLISRRASLRLSYLSLKNPDREPKLIGWLFYGIVAPPAELVPESAAPPVDTPVPEDTPAVS